MELPALFYGRYREVKPRVSRVLQRLRSGHDWVADVQADGMLDVATTSGYIVLDGPNRNLADNEHFHVFTLWAQAWKQREKMPRDAWESVFSRSLEQAWGVLGLVAYASIPWFYERERSAPFIRAVLRYWPVFVAVGARYSTGVDCGAALTEEPNAARYVFSNAGLPLELLTSPVGPGGMRELCAQYEITEKDLIDV